MKVTAFSIWFVAFCGLLLGVLTFLYFKGPNEAGKEYEPPFIGTINDSYLITGHIVVNSQVQLRSQYAGIVENVSVKAGDRVKKGDVIATIKVAHDELAISQAQSRYTQAKIEMDFSSDYLARLKLLPIGTSLSEQELRNASDKYQTDQEEFKLSRNQLELLTNGETSDGKYNLRVIKSPADGLILDVSALEGQFLTESSTFQAGSPVALIADTNDWFFEGFVPETDVSQLKPGMEIVVALDALPHSEFPSVITDISPKGVLTNGAIKFKIISKLSNVNGQPIRSNYGAIGKILRHQRRDVTLIREKNIVFKDSKTFVEISTPDGRQQTREIQIGISDGVLVEVASGLALSDRVKVR